MVQHARQLARQREPARVVCVHCAHDLPATVYCVMHCLGSLFGTLFINTVPKLLFISKKEMTLGIWGVTIFFLFYGYNFYKFIL